MPDVSDLISALNSKSQNDSNEVFAGLMQDKINSAMDDRKVAMAQSMTGTVDDEVPGIQDEDDAGIWGY